MGKETQIAWTDATFNPWIGCTKVSPGCDNCYAESQDKRWGHDSWGKGKTRRTTSDAYWKQPLIWNRQAAKDGMQIKVFCASLADVMDDEAPQGVRERLWDLINRTPNLTWQLLTKRPQRYSVYLPKQFAHGNVWLGTTAENQHYYNVRWPSLSNVAFRMGFVPWISYEPALGPLSVEGEMAEDYGRPAWIICGGESGNNRRDFEQKWAEDLSAECEMNGVKFFMKQMGARTPADGKSLIPAHLLINQFPEMR